jgi:pimeloyl-ACP methyl ester carboxylesterase
MLNCQTHGHGPPLLLLHGFGISFNIWSGLVPLLRDHFTLVIVELPGIGLSPLPPLSGPYLAAAVDALDSLRVSLAIPRWSVIGYSSGSRVAEAYLQSHAEHIERAVFLCPALTAPIKAAGLRAGIRLDAKYPQLGNWALSGWRIRFLIHLLGFNLRPNDKVSAWYAEITSQPVDILKETLRSMPEEGARPFDLPAEIPALFVWGREDWISATPSKPSARDVIIQANHSMPQTSAREVAEVILRFAL